MRRLRTTLAAAGLAATALSVPVATGASTASAGVPDSSPTASVTRTAVAARVGNHAIHCHGKAVRRCVWIQHDSTHHRFRAYAGIRDKKGGHAWWIKVTNVHLAWYDGEKLGKTAKDYDGWHPYTDHARGWWHDCSDGTYPIKAVAHFSWKGHSRGGVSMRSYTVDLKC